MSTPSIITEQGYVSGEGFGVTPVSESDKEKLEKSSDNKTEKED